MTPVDVEESTAPGVAEILAARGSFFAPPPPAVIADRGGARGETESLLYTDALFVAAWFVII